MQRASRFLALGLVATALLVMAGWRFQTPQVQHATVPVGQVVVELWRDPADGELAIQLRSADGWTILRRRTLVDVFEGHVNSMAVYLTAAGAWKSIRSRYGLTADRVDAALRRGDSVDRPSLMDVPKLDRQTRAYVFVRDFATDVPRLRRAVHFRVPAPGPTLAGLLLADVALVQFRGPGRLVDAGYVAHLAYSADPAHLGTGERQLGIDAASPRSGAAGTYKAAFLASHRRLVGPGYDARLTDSGTILRYHGTYVLVFPRWDLPVGQLREILSRIGRS
jgi:hypothetical protein